MARLGRFPLVADEVGLIPSTPPRRLRASWLVLRKELLEARRDRNLILQLVIVPLLLYPLLAFAAIQLSLVNQGAAERRPTVLWVDHDLPASIRASLEAESTLDVVEAPREFSDRLHSPSVEEFRALREAPSAGLAAPAAWLTWFRPEGSEVDSTVIVFDQSRDRSDDARDLAVNAVNDHADSLRLDRANAVGLLSADLSPWVTLHENVAGAAEAGRWLLSMILPVFLMIMLPQGAYYAVLDTVVGERERGTWETILTSPLGRGEVLVGKLAYVVLWSLVTFALNLVGLMILAVFALETFAPDAGIVLTLEPGSFAIAVAAVALLAITLASTMMMLAAGARSYREGQATLTPIYLIAAFAGTFVVVAGESFTIQQSLIPIVNVTAMLRAALQGEIPVIPALITFVELILLAFVCIGLASRLARSEAVLFDPDFSLRKSWRRLGVK